MPNVNQGSHGSLLSAPNSNLFLEAFFAAANEPAALIDASGTIVRANSAFATLAGMDPAEIAGLPLERALPGVPAAAALHANGAATVLPDGRAVTVTVIPLGEDGDRCVLVRAAAGGAGDGHHALGESLPLVVSAVVRDVTEVRRQQEAEARLAAIVDSANDAIISIDRNGMLTTWNAAAERTYGWTAAEAIGQPFLSLTVPPQLQEVAIAGWDTVRLGLPVPPFSTKRLRKGGSEFDATIALSPIIDRAGSVIGASAIVRDVSEVRRHEAAEALLAAIVRSAHDAIIVRSLEGEILSWNAAAERLYGWNAAETVGRPMAAFLPPDAPDLSTEIRERIRAGEQIAGFESRRLHRSGAPVDVSVSLSPVRDGDGNITAIASIAREIGEQRRQRDQIATLNAELELRLTDLEKAMAVKDEFLGSVSHELRTPLTSLVGLVHMLHERGELVDRESRREAIDQLATDAKRLQQIIENMLILARLDHTTFEPEPLLVQRVAPAVVAAHRKRFPSRPIFEDFPAGLPVVLAQRTWVDQVLTNLLSNAEKYTPPNAPVTVEAEEREHDVEIRVMDHGPGLSEEEARRVFEPFMRLQRDRYRGPGSGLGLAVCRRLVELMGGTIDACPRPGGGAIFRFRLPKAGDE